VGLWALELRRADSASQGGCLGALSGHERQVMSVAYSPRGNLLASGGTDEKLVVWDTRTGKSVRHIPAHSGPISSVNFSPDGTVIVTGSYDGLVRLWDVGSGHCLHTIVDEAAPCVGSAAFSHNSKFVVVSTLDSTIRVWDFAADKIVRSFKGHVNTRYCLSPALLCSSTDIRQHRVAAASEEGHSVVLWGLQSGKQTQSLDLGLWNPSSLCSHPHHDAVACGTLGEDAQVLLLVGGDSKWLEEESERDKAEFGIE
jgi:COMPASS component SWD3